MKLKYYGTAAAEGFPGMFCECDTCMRAREAGGKNIRTRSQSVIDGALLIDACPDTYLHVVNYGLDLTKIKSVLITHSHFDHFNTDVFACIGPGMAKRSIGEKLDVYGGASVVEKLTGIVPDKINLHLLKAYEEFETCGYKIIPIPAVHSSLTTPFNYIISGDGKTLLYGHDTGVYKDEIFEFIKNSGIVFDLVSLDCTYGAKKKDSCDHHMNIRSNLEIYARLGNIGATHENTVLVANHFSHFCENTHDELVKLTKDLVITVSFDGMEIEI